MPVLMNIEQGTRNIEQETCTLKGGGPLTSSSDSYRINIPCSIFFRFSPELIFNFAF